MKKRKERRSSCSSKYNTVNACKWTYSASLAKCRCGSNHQQSDWTCLAVPSSHLTPHQLLQYPHLCWNLCKLAHFGSFAQLKCCCCCWWCHYCWWHCFACWSLLCNCVWIILFWVSRWQCSLCLLNWFARHQWRAFYQVLLCTPWKCLISEAPLCRSLIDEHLGNSEKSNVYFKNKNIKVILYLNTGHYFEYFLQRVDEKLKTLVLFEMQSFSWLNLCFYIACFFKQ